jgi:uncharacterized membrane protein
VHLLGYDWPRLHAALNDLPAALLFVTVLFDLAAWITRRASLAAAGAWTLWAGVVGGWLAVVAGLQAQDVIEHGEAVHRLMEKHETLALVTMGVFTLLLGYRLLRRGIPAAGETLAVRGLSVVGLVGIIWTASVGGKMMFEHAAGVPTAVLKTEIRDRALHHHHHGEAAPDSGDHEHGGEGEHEH